MTCIVVESNIFYLIFSFAFISTQAGLLGSVRNQGRAQSNQWSTNNNRNLRNITNALFKGNKESPNRETYANNVFRLNGQDNDMNFGLSKVENFGGKPINWNSTGQIFGRRPSLEKEKVELEQLLEKLKQINKLKDQQENDGANISDGNTSGVLRNNKDTWKKLTKRKLMFQFKPIFPHGESHEDKTESVYYLDFIV